MQTTNIVRGRIIGKPVDVSDSDRLDVDGMGIDLDAIVTANRCRLNRPSALDELDDWNRGGWRHYAQPR